VTLEQITAVTIGMTFNSLTFVLGVLVGCSLMKRKEPENGDCNTEGEVGWHHVAGERTAGGPGGCRAGCTKPKPEADPAKRPSW
jgi:hypothetical protein